MVLFLTSRLNTLVKDKDGNKTTIPLENVNGVLDNIKKYLSATNRIVYVANDPNNVIENEERIKNTIDSFSLSNLNFNEKILLDARNKKDAKNIILGANIVILSGGKILCQNKFFRSIRLKKILKHFNGIVIGISAGTMNLCKTVFNFPEEKADIKERKWVKGLGFYDKIIIPHFDGETNTYQIECEEVDVVNDYIFPASHKKEFLGIPNGSYILIDGNKNVSFFGEMYAIENGVTKKIER
ncbi:MAG TPA: Type 1 glutamine amidotransferase-like domain-containing protein [Candidatus Onthoplasma faecipullorum]|nr:Type 1 glutamine amidotransferase-like domain-containing protein [Candidatus Onthoplasma faecipullorum]